MAKLSLEDVIQRLEEAATTMRKLPTATVQGFKSNWPAILHDPNEAYGYNPMGHVRLLAQSQHITEMDEALRWLNWLNAYQVKLLWWYCDGLRWKTIQRLMEKRGVAKSIRMLQFDLKEAFYVVWFALSNGTPVRGRTTSTFNWPTTKPKPVFSTPTHSKSCPTPRNPAQSGSTSTRASPKS